MTCIECSTDYDPDLYEQVCNSCGRQLERRIERMQREFDDEQLTLAEVAGRAAGNAVRAIRRRWRAG
jgi:threonine synthase